jgi:Terminase RNaseH-like domain
VYTFPNGSEIHCCGLDDKERTEKVLGLEFVTMYHNECSQTPLASIDIAQSRLAQLVYQEVEGMPRTLLRPRVFYDCNPPTKAHWTYKRFILKQDPETRLNVSDPSDYVSFKINPQDNQDNISPDYITKTLAGMSSRNRKRFMDGEFADANPNALFPVEHIDRWRVVDGVVPDLVRIVVGVDPSGASDDPDQNSDAIGIIVGGVGIDGNAYLLEDLTVTAGPATWGKVAASAYARHEANLIVAESNFGGEMVRFVVRTADPKAAFKMVHSSRGKFVRAEPFSALYELGKVRHVGAFSDLEDELADFSTHGYTGAKSPNRADAWIFVLAELFPGVVKSKGEVKQKLNLNLPQYEGAGWMA